LSAPAAAAVSRESAATLELAAARTCARSTSLCARVQERQLGTVCSLNPIASMRTGSSCLASPPPRCAHFVGALVENNDDELMQEEMP